MSTGAELSQLEMLFQKTIHPIYAENRAKLEISA